MGNNQLNNSSQKSLSVNGSSNSPLLQRSDRGFGSFLRALVMSPTERANKVNRNISEYKPAPIASFYDPSFGVYNTVVSGGIKEIRTRAMVAQTVCAVQNHFPVIVIHEGNHLLEQQLRDNYYNIGNYSEISSTSPCFEPFYGLDEFEISNLVLDASPKNFDIKFNARYYIEGVSRFLQKSGKHLSFKMLSTCPHSQIFDKVDDLRLQGIINDSEEQEIKSKLMMGQTENYKLDSFFAALKKEISPVMYVSKRGYKPENIISSVKKNHVLSIDINSVTNKMFVNVLIYQLKLALTLGFQYTLIIDSIPINTNEEYANYIKSPSDKICKMISTEDLYSMVGGDEKLFAEIVGNSQISVVMNHRSGNSATKWAEFFGQYDRYDETYSNSRGSSRGAFEFFGSTNQQNGVSVSKNRAFIIQPEQITRMAQTEAYILTAARGELAHLILSG